MTIRDLITRWAPPSENDTESYIKHVSDYSGLPDNHPIDLLNEDLMIKIFQSMTKHEIGVTAYSNYEFWEEDIKRGINLL